MTALSQHLELNALKIATAIKALRYRGIETISFENAAKPVLRVEVSEALKHIKPRFQLVRRSQGQRQEFWAADFEGCQLQWEETV